MWKGTVTEKGPEMCTPPHFSARLRVAAGERPPPAPSSAARPGLGVLGSDLAPLSPSSSGPPRSSSCAFGFSSGLSCSAGKGSAGPGEGQVSKLSLRCGGCFTERVVLSRGSSAPGGGLESGPGSPGPGAPQNRGWCRARRRGHGPRLGHHCPVLP